MLPRPPRLARVLVLAGALAVWLSAGAAHAQVSVFSDVQTTNGTQFDYSYSITNSTHQDLSILTFSAPFQADALTHLTAPTGFFISFDPGVGLFSFAEDDDPGTFQTFAPGTTVSGFSFSSYYGPAVTQYEALDAVGNSFSGIALTPTGTAVTPVPEASSAILLGLGLAGLTLFTTRRRVQNALAASRA